MRPIDSDLKRERARLDEGQKHAVTVMCSLLFS